MLFEGEKNDEWQTALAFLNDLFYHLKIPDDLL